MDTVVLSSLLNGVLLLVCLGLLLSFCVICGQSGRQTPINQQGGFTIIRATVDTHVPRPCVSNPAISLTPAPSSLRSPWQEPERRPSNTPTEDDDDSYVNQDSDSYIEVLTDDIPSKPKYGSQPSQSSGNDEIYVNVEQESDNVEYINMPEHENGGLTPDQAISYLEGGCYYGNSGESLKFV